MRTCCILVSLLCAYSAGPVCAANVAVALRGTIAVGRSPRELAITPDKREVYVTNLNDDTVSVIAWPEQRVQTLDVCDEPWVVSASPDGSLIVVGCRGSVALITVTTKRVTIVRCGAWVWDVLFTQDSAGVYIAGQRSGLLYLDIRTMQVRVIDATPAPMKLAVTPDGRTLYVNYQSSGPGGRPGHDAIGKHDAKTGKRLTTILSLPNVGGPLAISPDGRRLWANGYDACMSRRYDHEGCPMVPATIVNIFSIPGHAVMSQLSRSEQAVRQTITFSPTGRYVIVSGEDPLVYDARTLRLVGGARGYGTIDWVFPANDNLGLATLHARDAVGIFSLRAQ